jgi:hypothetical protein
MKSARYLALHLYRYRAGRSGAAGDLGEARPPSATTPDASEIRLIGYGRSAVCRFTLEQSAIADDRHLGR